MTVLKVSLWLSNMFELDYTCENCSDECMTVCSKWNKFQTSKYPEITQFEPNLGLTKLSWWRHDCAHYTRNKCKQHQMSVRYTVCVWTPRTRINNAFITDMTLPNIYTLHIHTRTHKHTGIHSFTSHRKKTPPLKGNIKSSRTHRPTCLRTHI